MLYSFPVNAPNEMIMREFKYIMGSGIDVLKLKTSMRLFNKVSPNDVFEKVLDAFFLNHSE